MFTRTYAIHKSEQGDELERKAEQMKAKAVVLQSNKLIVQVFVVAALACLFSHYANAAATKTTAGKKSVKVAKPKSKFAAKSKSKTISKAPVLKVQADAAEKAKTSVMFLNLSQRQLLASNTAAKAADAKLEGEFMKDSIPIAAPANSSIAAKVETSPAKKDLEVGAAFSIETSTGINSAEKKSYSGEYALVPSIKYNPLALSAFGKIAYGREYTSQKEDNTDGDLSSIALGIRKAIKLGGGLVDSVHFGPNFVIPAGNEARRQTFNGAIGATLGATKVIGKLSLKQELGYAYRFYRFDIRDNGVINSPHSFSSSSSAGVEITKWFGLSAEFAAQQLINFQGTPAAFTSTAVEAAFTLSEKASLALGLATALAGTLDDDGQSSRILLYDPGVTAAYLTLGLSI